jgi:hypothetical protein
MTVPPKLRDHPSVSEEERASDELVKRIRKLRWIGMEDEARALQDSLYRAPPSAPVLATPTDTD